MMNYAPMPCPGALDITDCPVIRQKTRARDSQDREAAIRAYVMAHKPATGRLLQGLFEFGTLEEAEKLSTMLGSQCPDPEIASVGIWELLSNAVEHGNLAIDREMKAMLLREGRFLDEIAARMAAPEYRDRLVRVAFRRSHNAIRIRVEDEGAGFDYASVLSPAGVSTAPNGRGLMMVRKLAFHRLVFRGAGNIVEATIRF